MGVPIITNSSRRTFFGADIVGDQCEAMTIKKSINNLEQVIRHKSFKIVIEPSPFELIQNMQGFTTGCSCISSLYY